MGSQDDGAYTYISRAKFLRLTGTFSTSLWQAVSRELPFSRSLTDPYPTYWLWS